jgi:hypothetical protein
MSDELFEVAFSGIISEGADPVEVKTRVAKMFNADSVKLAQLFSGQRVVIKKNSDTQTAQKYQTALNRAGAECELKPLTTSVDEPKIAPASIVAAPAAPISPAEPAVAEPAASIASSATAVDTDIAPPQVDPLGITANEIEDLSATIAPVGSELQNEIREVPEPEYDLSELDVAPVGSVLGAQKKEPDPPPPDTTGLSMAD